MLSRLVTRVAATGRRQLASASSNSASANKKDSTSGLWLVPGVAGVLFVGACGVIMIRQKMQSRQYGKLSFDESAPVNKWGTGAVRDADSDAAATPVLLERLSVAAPASESARDDVPHETKKSEAAAAKDTAAPVAAPSSNQQTDVPLEQLSAKLQQLGSPVLVGVDVGGTNIRVAFSRVDGSDTFVLETFAERDSVEQLLDTLSACGAVVQELGVEVGGAAIAVAGPRKGDGMTVTNYQEGHQDLPRNVLPASLFPFARSAMLNDLEATGYGLVALNQRGAIQTLFKCLDSDATAALQPGPALVIAVGTGLGVALIYPVNNALSTVVPLEGGHSLITQVGPDNEDRAREERLLSHLSRKIWQGKHSIEYEDICSGRGLEAVYEWVILDRHNQQQSLRGAEIAKRARAGDEDALEALSLFYRYQMRAATNFGLTLRPTTIVLAGDNQVRNGWLLESQATELRKELVNAPRGQAWLGDVPVLVQTVVRNVNIEGALHIAQQKCEEVARAR
eukprot:TRINITY_DN12776_c0_g1_i1.p1 TRINITY_DN12776_c0_g1~~TRINITY_DN12776_c0_g1_i1.p1  ORF type:complete len:509 (+),score=146.84 TRINITY_DN12776_c0_g1_i1:111-1637(+)